MDGLALAFFRLLDEVPGRRRGYISAVPELRPDVARRLARRSFAMSFAWFIGLTRKHRSDAIPTSEEPLRGEDWARSPRSPRASNGFRVPDMQSNHATGMWPSKCRRAHQLPVVYAQRLPPSCCQCTSRAAISCAVSGPRRTLARCEQHIDETVLARRAVLESNDEGRFGQLASTRARLVRFGIGLDDG